MAMLFSGSKQYIYEIRRYVIVSVLISLISVYFGYLISSSSSDFVRQTIESFKQMVSPLEGASALRIFVFIFLKNTIAAFIAAFLGIVFGIVPMFSLLVNGLYLGIFAYLFFQQDAAIVFFAGILPHGIIEIPAFILSAATGFWLGVAVIRRIVFGERKVIEKTRLAVEFFFGTLLPMLFVAALIEAFITPLVLELAR